MTDTRHYQWDLTAVEVSHEPGCPFQFLSLGLFGCVSGDVRLKCLSDIFGAKNEIEINIKQEKCKLGACYSPNMVRNGDRRWF